MVKKNNNTNNEDLLSKIERLSKIINAQKKSMTDSLNKLSRSYQSYNQSITSEDHNNFYTFQILYTRLKLFKKFINLLTYVRMQCPKFKNFIKGFLK